MSLMMAPRWLSPFGGVDRAHGRLDSLRYAIHCETDLRASPSQPSPVSGSGRAARESDASGRVVGTIDVHVPAAAGEVLKVSLRSGQRVSLYEVEGATGGAVNAASACPGGHHRRDALTEC